MSVALLPKEECSIQLMFLLVAWFHGKGLKKVKGFHKISHVVEARPQSPRCAFREFVFTPETRFLYGVSVGHYK